MKKLPKKKIELTEEQKIEKMASYGLNNIEIAEILGYDDTTLKRGFEKFLTKGRSVLKMKLKRKQIDVALKGNVVMLIWLGKQYLGQAEKTEESGDYEITIKRKIIGEEVSAELKECQKN